MSGEELELKDVGWQIASGDRHWRKRRRRGRMKSWIIVILKGARLQGLQKSTRGAETAFSVVRWQTVRAKSTAPVRSWGDLWHVSASRNKTQYGAACRREMFASDDEPQAGFQISSRGLTAGRSPCPP